jgi:thiamine biosynthesis lipoprotein
MYRMKQNWFLVFLLILIIFILIFMRYGFRQQKSRAFFFMDTFFEITSSSKYLNESSFNEIDKLVNMIDGQINSYNPNSEVSLINLNAGVKPVQVSKETFLLLKKAYHYSEISDGLFDVTFKPLQDLYGFETGKFTLPTSISIENAKKKVNYKKIYFQESSDSVYLTELGMNINTSAIMKGYVLDRVKLLLSQNHIPNYFLNFGGNLYIHGDKSEKIGIKHPRKENVIFSFPLKNGFVSTSADYQQFFQQGTMRYTHIVNPLSGLCNQKMQSVTVVANSGIESDFLSTTLFLLDPGEIGKWLQDKKINVQYYAYDGSKEFTNIWEKKP